MCGIAGYIGFKEHSSNRIQETLEKMRNRGPDAKDFISHEMGEKKVYLLHSRLSILDLDVRSNQPYIFEHLSLIFNGEIYNYIEVREKLRSQGYSFSTASDTEVLIKSYHCWGKEAFEKLEGMWSLAILDSRDAQLILCKDRFTEKPLFHYQTEHGIYFGSEVKFIKTLSSESIEINDYQIKRYLVNGYKSLYKHGDTFYAGVNELEAGSYAAIDHSLELSERTYWTPNPVINNNLTREDAIEGVRERLINSVKLRLRSDVPLAFCLSGGIDSASLVSIAAKEFNYNVSTFSIIDPDERYNELENINHTINDLGCEHTLIHLDSSNMLERLTDLVSYHDGPVATISYLVHSMLSEKISEKGYKVSISGTAADELLTGYYDHFNLHLYECRNSESFSKYLREWNEHLKPIVRNPFLQNPKLYFDNQKFRDHIYLNNDQFEAMLLEDFHEDFVETSFTSSLLQNRMLNELFYEGTRVILHEDDLNSMFYSIENRSPYLDSSLFEFAYSIPPELLINDGYGKFILRQAMKGILNENVRLDRHKKGFNASINSIIDFQEKSQRELILDDSPIYNIVDKSKIESILSQESLPNSYSKFIFSFLNSKIFLEQNVR